MRTTDGGRQQLPPIAIEPVRGNVEGDAAKGERAEVRPQPGFVDTNDADAFSDSV